jgi:hypothetical protein
VVSQFKQVVGLSLVCLGLAACAGPQHTVRYAFPRQAPVAESAPPARENVQYAVVHAPRVILPAPPLQAPAMAPASQAPASPVASNAAPAPESAAAASPAAPTVSSPLAPFTPQASPLLAAFDSSPRGQPPRVEPYVQQVQQAYAARAVGWDLGSYPYYRSRRSYGYSPY